MAIDLNEAKNKIFQYVESRMFLFAPNLTHICGPSTAAKLMGVLASLSVLLFILVSGTAGGLTALSRIPACNIQVH